ncbi:YfaP family protein [Maribacter aestuarii]|uniref:YfaP family protein n=1 Tax=Maribacter aestuarii TaxID=1130723 RepID=UPI0025A64401|nr:TonB-dependent receptor plug domain-containing protein [Maribacter aestuarii]
MKRITLLLILLVSLVSAQNMENKDITICWDTSFSMLDRDLEKEFDLLDKVFQRSPNQKVQLILFNIITEEKEFQITDGDWSELKDVLIQSKADGATIYDGLADLIKNDQVYFFTDGNALIADDNIPIKKGNFLINSLPDRNENFLKQSALLGRGRLMDFAAILPDNIQSTVTGGANEQPKAIAGTVYIDNVPADEIEVRIKGTETVYKTDDSGKFSLPAVPGDSILISSRSNRTMKTVPIGYFDSNVDIFLEANVTTLDEVVVTEKRVEAISKDLVNTGNGLKSKEELGYAVQSIGEEEITPIQTDLSQSLQGKFSNVTLGGDQDLTQFKGRSNNTLLGNNYGLVVVDGVPIQQSDSSTGFLGDASFINPANVADITVLKGFAATNRYGTLGNNGVLLITTKTALAGKGSGALANSALVQDNVYESDTEMNLNQSALTKALENTGTTEEAYSKYLTLRNFNEKNVPFYLDAFAHFKDKDHKLAAIIISNLWELNPKDETYMKLVELSSRYLGNNSLSAIINNELNRSRPTAIQPFFTEAKLQLAKGDYQEALNSLSVLEKGGAYGTMNVTPISKSLERELKNLVFQKRSSLDVTRVKEAYFKNTQMNVRLLVEWSNPKAEFEIQFVNPQNRFFNWEHTTGANQNRIQEEVTLGYAMEEFEIYDDLKGDWKINAIYKGNLEPENDDPLVLLCSVYENFGYPSQKKKLVWLYLDNQGTKKRIVEVKI